MKKDFKVYCDDILESIELIRKYIANTNFEALTKDIGMQDQVIRRLEIIGEAVKRLPEDLKRENPNIPWTDIAGTAIG